MKAGESVGVDAHVSVSRYQELDRQLHTLSHS